MSLTALSPLDGRYSEKTDSLKPIMSEYGLIRYRVIVEIRWLIALLQEKAITDLPVLTDAIRQKLENLLTEFDHQSAQIIKKIEKTTYHDVKAVEYFLQEQFQKDPELTPLIPLIHFSCTSEDINNLAYSLMLTEASKSVLQPAMRSIINALIAKAEQYARLPMLSRTHGQPASPTTLGKEYANVAMRLLPIYQQFAAFVLPGKMNGAVGNYNAHRVAYPDVNWPKVTQRLVTDLGLQFNAFTTQIEPHDQLVEWLQIFIRFNQVLMDYCRDVWSYISINYFQQTVIASQVGSSTMPHKVNPIDFENAEGNLGIANALAQHMVSKLPISRWQRDLTDSTVLRNLGSVLGYGLIAYQSITVGNAKISANEMVIKNDLLAHGEVIAEAVQTVLRRYGVNEAYEQLKALTRGKVFNTDAFLAFIEQLQLPEEIKNRLRSLTPDTYIGYAEELALQIKGYTL